MPAGENVERPPGLLPICPVKDPSPIRVYDRQYPARTTKSPVSPVMRRTPLRSALGVQATPTLGATLFQSVGYGLSPSPADGTVEHLRQYARLEDVPDAGHAVDIVDVADGVTVVLGHERELQLVADTEVQRHVRVHPPRILGKQPDFSLLRALCAETEVPVLTRRLVESSDTPDLAHPAGHDRVVVPGGREHRIVGARKVVRGELGFGRITLDTPKRSSGSSCWLSSQASKFV